MKIETGLHTDIFTQLGGITTEQGLLMDLAIPYFDEVAQAKENLRIVTNELPEAIFLNPELLDFLGKLTTGGGTVNVITSDNAVAMHPEVVDHMSSAKVKIHTLRYVPFSLFTLVDTTKRLTLVPSPSKPTQWRLSVLPGGNDTLYTRLHDRLMEQAILLS